MPTLTNAMGLDVAFRADAVIAVADRDPESGADVTCVYGLGPSFQKVRETVDGFLTRIGRRDQFAAFTRPNGTAIWISAPAVSVVTMAAQQGLYSADTKTVIIAGAFTQAVKESMDAVKATAARFKFSAGCVRKTASHFSSTRFRRCG